MQNIFYIIFVINVVLSLAIIMLERKNPEKTIAWLLIFIVMPPFGLIAYLFLGRNWKKHKLNNETTVNIKELIYLYPYHLYCLIFQ